MVPNAKISVLSSQNLSYIKKTKGALGLWCPTPKSHLYQENQRSVRIMVPNAKISLISRKPKEH